MAKLPRGVNANGVVEEWPSDTCRIGSGVRGGSAGAGGGGASALAGRTDGGAARGHRLLRGRGGGSRRGGGRGRDRGRRGGGRRDHHRGRGARRRAPGGADARGGPVAVDDAVAVHHAFLDHRGRRRGRGDDARVGEVGHGVRGDAEAPHEPAVEAHRLPHGPVADVGASAGVATGRVERDALAGGVVRRLGEGRVAGRDAAVAERRAVDPDRAGAAGRTRELDRVADGLRGDDAGDARDAHDREAGENETLHGDLSLSGRWFDAPFVQRRIFSTFNEEHIDLF